MRYRDFVYKTSSPLLRSNLSSPLRLFAVSYIIIAGILVDRDFSAGQRTVLKNPSEKFPDSSSKILKKQATPLRSYDQQIFFRWSHLGLHLHSDS